MSILHRFANWVAWEVLILGTVLFSIYHFGPYGAIVGVLLLVH